jgi:hypothetical protein
VRLLAPLKDSNTRTITTGTAPDRPRAQLVRCACAVCGTHTNALKTFRVAGSCSNCGSFDLVAVEGAEPLGGPFAA